TMRGDLGDRPEPSKDYRELCEFLPWGYLVLDDSARIRELNPAALKLLGAPWREALGSLLQGYLANGSVDSLLNALDKSRSGIVSEEVRLELVARDGRIRHIKLHARWCGSAIEPGYRVAMLDTTEIRRANLALTRAADEMRDLYENAPCGYHSLDPNPTLVPIH